MDMVSREEHEAVKEMAAAARDDNERLEARIAALEARLDAKADASSVPAAIDFFERSIVCLGHTALCLSGGGSLAMYRKHCRSRSARTAADPHARRDCDLEFLRSAAADPHVWRTPISQGLSS
jgi:hypothetical protein